MKFSYSIKWSWAETHHQPSLASHFLSCAQPTLRPGTARASALPDRHPDLT
jgi:hypothetical protein